MNKKRFNKLIFIMLIILVVLYFCSCNINIYQTPTTTTTASFILINSGSSMRDSIENGDKLVVTKLLDKPTQKDIVVIKTNEGAQIVKRVIATEGQTVDIKDGSVSIDGVKINEPYTRTETRITEDVKFPITVPHDAVFVMGDNRNDSHDSRSTQIGMVNIKNIIGKVINIIK